MDMDTEGVSKTFILGVGISIAFVIFIVALSLIGQVLSSVQVQGSANNFYNSNVTNETFIGNTTLANSGAFTNANNIDNSTEIVTNGSRTFTRTTEYNLTKNGVFTILPSATIVGNTKLNITYNYTGFVRDVDFNVSGGGLIGVNSVGGLIPTMGIIFGIVLVLAILMTLAAVWGFNSLGK